MIHLQNTTNRYAGTIITVNQHGAELIRETIQCCHCQSHKVFDRHKKKKFGWCPKCNDFTCGQKDCDPCNGGK